MYAFSEDGSLRRVIEVPGTPIGALTVWRTLEKKYLPTYRPDYIKEKAWYKEGMTDSELENAYCSIANGSELSRVNAMKPGSLQEIYDLAGDARLSLEERIVLSTTIPGRLLASDRFKVASEALRDFQGLTIFTPQADILDELASERSVAAVGWKQGAYLGIDWEHPPLSAMKIVGGVYNFKRNTFHQWIM